MSAREWRFLVPQLPVSDVAASQRWYRDVLGFGINWIWEDNFGSVGEGDIELFLFESDDPHPVVCSVFVEDVEGGYAECRERDAEIVSELESKPWGVREFTVRDPDGNRFRIGQGEDAVTEVAELSVPEERER